MTIPLWSWALTYIRADLHVLALTGKRPNPKYHAAWDYDNSIWGDPETPEDLAAFQAIFEDPSTTGVAILIPEHIHVADIDTEDAAAVWMKYIEDIPNTRTVRTPNGLHLWFWSPGANGSVWLWQRALLLKGLGGYVAAPPSKHFNEQGEQDGVYTWVGEWRQIDYMPKRLEEAIKAHDANETKAPPERDPLVDHRIRLDADGRLWMWSEPSMKNILAYVAGVPAGNRNNTLFWAAMRVAEEGVPLSVAMTPLMEAAEKAHLTKRESQATIRSAYRRLRSE